MLDKPDFEVPFPEVIDSTMLNDWRSCRRKGLFHHLEHWKGRGGSIHLHAGAAFARGLEVARHCFYAEGKQADIALQEGVHALLVAYGDFDDGGHAKSATRMAEALVYYFDQYPLGRDPKVPHLFPSGKLGIEFSFATPLEFDHPVTGQPLIYTGRADLVCDFAGGVWILDDKTTTSLGASWGNQWKLRAQFTSYCWAAREAGIKVEGVIARGVSILKTKYDTLEVPTHRPEWMIEEWLSATYDELHEMVKEWRLGYAPFNTYRKNFGEACASYGGCEFTDVCQSDQPRKWLPMNFERRRWDPIHRTETLLED